MGILRRKRFWTDEDENSLNPSRFYYEHKETRMRIAGQDDLEEAFKHMEREQKEIWVLLIERANHGLLDSTLITGDDS